MKEKRDFKGIWIPKEIWLSEDLTLQEKVFLTEIDSLDNKDGCYATNDYFAAFFKLSKHRCSQVINALISKKYIKAEYHRKGEEIVKRVLRICHEGVKDMSRRCLGNVTENNTVNNTINTLQPSKKKAKVNPEHNECMKHFFRLTLNELHRKPKWGGHEASLLKRDLDRFVGIPGLTQSPGTILKWAMEIWMLKDHNNQRLLDFSQKNGYTYSGFSSCLDTILEIMRKRAKGV